MALVPNDAVAQFSLLENQFSPEFGGASGGIFNTITKSGTNQLHGSVYEYLNNRNLNAVTSQQAIQGFTSPPRFDYNRFGGTIGGPIIKNKLFYFGDYEYSPLGEASVPNAPIEAPTAAGYATIATLPGISQTNLNVLKQYLAPAPTANAGTITVAGVNIPVGTIPVSGPSYVNKQNVVGAVDYYLISSNDQIRGRYYYNKYSGIDTFASLPVFYTLIPDNRYLLSLSEFHTFTPTFLNEFRVSYDHKNNNYPVGNFKFPGLDQFPNLEFYDVGVQLGPDPNAPQGYTQGSAELTDNLTKTMGKHTFKAGFHMEDIIASNSFIQRARGDYEYSTLDLYLRDQSPDEIGERSVGVAGGIPAGYLYSAGFFNDDYRVKPNLTLNLGVRYEYVTVPVVSRYQDSSALANYPGLITFGTPQSQKTNWAPRVGIAWSPGKSGLWSVRTGFGINYDNQYNNLSINEKPAYFSLTEDVPSLTTLTPNFLANGGLPPSNAIPLPTTVAAARAGISAYTPNQIRPYSINGSIAIQRSLGKDYTVEARYVYTKGVHLFVQEQLNRVTPLSSTYGLPTFFSPPSAAQLSALSLTLGQVKAKQLAETNYPASPSNSYGQYGFPGTITEEAPIGDSRYNGLALSLNKRYSKGFSYLTNFTWSHARQDDSTATVFSTVLTPRRGEDFNNLRADWGDSPLDRRLRFVFTPMYDVKVASGNWVMKNIVGNWNVSATYTYQSPEYATVQSGIDSNLNNDSVDRAVVNPAGKATVGSGVYAVTSTGATVAAGSANIVAYVASNPNARYVQAGQGAFPNGGRDTLRMNPIDNIDFQILKRFQLKERVRLELGGQFSNLLNHPQWTGDLLNDVYPLTGYTSYRNMLLPADPNFNFGSDLYYPSNSARSRWSEGSCF